MNDATSHLNKLSVDWEEDDYDNNRVVFKNEAGLSVAKLVMNQGKFYEVDGEWSYIPNGV